MALEMEAQEIVKLLDMQPHPEGGYYKVSVRSFRSSVFLYQYIYIYLYKYLSGPQRVVLLARLGDDHHCASS
jgi:hypothetical protein